MNSMPHLAALVALLYEAISHAQNDLASAELAVAFTILFFAWIPMTVMAVVTDATGLRGRDG